MPREMQPIPVVKARDPLMHGEPVDSLVADIRAQVRAGKNCVEKIFDTYGSVEEAIAELEEWRERSEEQDRSAGAPGDADEPVVEGD